MGGRIMTFAVRVFSAMPTPLDRSPLFDVALEDYASPSLSKRAGARSLQTVAIGEATCLAESPATPATACRMRKEVVALATFRRKIGVFRIVADEARKMKTHRGWPARTPASCRWRKFMIGTRSSRWIPIFRSIGSMAAHRSG
jgi:hypothetical protein